MAAKQKKQDSGLLIGLGILAVAGIAIATTLKPGKAAAAGPGQPGQPALPEGVAPERSGRIVILFGEGGQRTHSLTPISPSITVVNGTDNQAVITLIVEVQHQVIGRWIEVACSTPIVIDPGQSRRVVVPAFAFEPSSIFKGQWSIRGTIWDAQGEIVAENSESGFYILV